MTDEELLAALTRIAEKTIADPTTTSAMRTIVDALLDKFLDSLVEPATLAAIVLAMLQSRGYEPMVVRGGRPWVQKRGSSVPVPILSAFRLELEAEIDSMLAAAAQKGEVR